ncbi:MAG: glycosyltransferase family 4 protein [Bacteroidales bacterium]|nr:glycosyltransferase family 4 protein [Bacteroidales bacterium]MBR1799461.1 glycosyltransferase family 4 protein [Bacteroidales bacterium]
MIKDKMDGIGCFTAESMSRIVQDHPEHQFFFFFDRRPDPDFIFANNVCPVVLYPQARHPLLWWPYFEWATTTALRRYKIDLYVSPDGMMPLHSTLPTLTVIHDLNFEHFPENLRRSHQAYMNYYFPRFAKRATRIATVSEYSKKDIIETYNIDAGKIDVVYNGSAEAYHPRSEEENAATRRLYSNGEPYVLFVSTILRRKNLANLLQAFDTLEAVHNGTLRLLVVGTRTWWGDELQAAYNNMEHKDSVSFLGHLNTPELSRLMSAAEMLVYPSLFEGFGIPILEAQYTETAVVASKTTSMPEVGGDAALYVDPLKPTEISNAIKQFLNPAIRQKYIEKGRIQREKFSWQKTANLLWKSMMKTVNKQ